MKYAIRNNCLIILYDNDFVKENATQNQTECIYCIYNPLNCEATDRTKKYGGQFCDTMKCKYQESE